MDKGHRLAEDVCLLLHGEEPETIIPLLVGILASVAVHTCNDKNIILGYINHVISLAYAEVDHSGEPLQ